MRIVFVLEHFYPYIGGAEKLFYVLCTQLVKEGYDVTVITSRYDRKLQSEETHKGMKIVRVNCYNRFGFTFFSLPKILNYARNSQLIHTTTYNAALPAIIAGVLIRKPVFITFHEVWGKLWKELPFISAIGKNVFYLFEKMLLKLPFDKFIAVSEFTKRKLIESGIAESKIKRIYNGIDYESFNSFQHKSPDVFTFTYFGRLGVSKGLDLIIPAAAKFKKAYPESKLKLIIPKQPAGMFNEITRMVSSYDLDTYVEYKHNLPRGELYQELLSSSCVIISSYSEGFCFAAAEAVALKIPIISSDQGALKEVVSGRFVKMEEQTSEALFMAMQEAYFHNWNQTDIRYYHLSDAIKEYTEMYNEVTILK